MRQRCDINFGATRAVFLVGRWALKVPFAWSWMHFLLGLVANIQEVTFSKAQWPELCPVLWWLPGGWLVVMRRAAPLSDDQWAAFEPTIEEWMNKGDYYVPSEPKRDSYGMLEGRVVAIDYGN